MIRILDPTFGDPTFGDPTAGTGPAPAPFPLAPRPVSLSGATLGLLANGKSNGMALLDRIAAHLRERHGVAEIVRVAKTNASAPAAEEDAGLLAKRCAAIVTAVGD